MANRNPVLDFLLCYACIRLLTPRPRVVAVPVASQQYTYARVGDSVSASATGGALADLPLIACATMTRDEEGVTGAAPDSV